jgi:hypothetical protein
VLAVASAAATFRRVGCGRRDFDLDTYAFHRQPIKFSVFRRFLYVVDNDDFHGPLSRLKFEAELL